MQHGLSHLNSKYSKIIIEDLFGKTRAVITNSSKFACRSRVSDVERRTARAHTQMLEVGDRELYYSRSLENNEAILVANQATPLPQSLESSLRDHYLLTQFMIKKLKNAAQHDKKELNFVSRLFLDKRQL